jgi:DNA-directed RNA polymerase sigma subunit (sigma70/sigma32)
VTFAGGVAIHWLPEEEPERQTCSLDLAERGGMGMDEVGLLLGCSKERVRQIEESALASLTELMTDER